MLDALEPLTIRIDEEAVPPAPCGAEWAGLSLPLVRRVADRLAILGSGTLWQSRARLYLATAAHLFEHGMRASDIGIAGPGHGEIFWLGMQARELRRHPHADVAVVRIADADSIPRHWRRYPLGLLGFEPAAGPPAAALAPGGRFVLSGWPAQQTRWSENGLVAQPIVCFTTAHPAEVGAFRYGRIAESADGLALETPALDGVSGALVWRVEPASDCCRLEPAGLQVSFAHGRLLRCEPVAALRALIP